MFFRYMVDFGTTEPFRYNDEIGTCPFRYNVQFGTLQPRVIKTLRAHVMHLGATQIFLGISADKCLAGRWVTAVRDRPMEDNNGNLTPAVQNP